MISQDPDAPPGLIGISAIGEVQTTNNFTETGTYTDCTLSPSKFEQGCVFQLACTNETVDIFIFSEMGSLNENWSCPDGGGPSQLMVEGFSDVFQSAHGTQNITVDHACVYYFTVQWQNMQSQPANETFTGHGQFVVNENVTFTIQVEHNPQAAPQKLTL